MFIVIEGCDCTGKSSQVERLRQKIQSAGHICVSHSFPNYTSNTGHLIRQYLDGKISLGNGLLLDGKNADPFIFQSLQTIDRYAVAGAIEAQLTLGWDVVCGRWWQSSYAYGRYDGLDSAWLKQISSHLPTADINILIDLDPDEARKRNDGREGDPDRYERDLVRQRKVRELYLSLWKGACGSEPLSGFWTIVDGMGTADEVHDRMMDSHWWLQRIRT